MLSLEFAHGRSGFQPTVEIFQKAAMEVVDFSVEFCGGFFGRKMQKKNPPKNPPENPPTENKKSTGARPPEIRQPNPIICCKTYQQIRLSNIQVHAGLFSIEKACSWRCLQSMDSGTLLGCLLGMVEAPMLKCTCIPSAPAGGRDKVCCAPFQTILLVKSVCFEKRPQNQKKKNPPRGSANSSSPKKRLRFRASRCKTLALKRKHIVIVSCNLEAFLRARASVQVPCAQNTWRFSVAMLNQLCPWM